MKFDTGPDEIKIGRFKSTNVKQPNPHTLFRKKKVWKDFRITMLERDDWYYRCELCNTKYTGKRSRMLQAHHHDPANYEVLDPKMFSVLCFSHHEMIEVFTSMIMGKNWQPPANIQEWWNLIGHHLALPAREKVLGHLNQNKIENRIKRIEKETK